MLASPLVMATVVASVQSGRTVVPYLLEDYRPEADPDGAARAGTRPRPWLT